jgi:hypothetical protein
MGDVGDFYRERRDEQRQHRLRHGVGFHLNGRTSPKRDTRITMAVDADSERAACDFMRQLARDRGADAVNYAWALPMEGGQLPLPVPPPAEGS